MSSPSSPVPYGGHDRRTRILHMAIAVIVIWQLLSSQFMSAPRRGQPGDFIFEIHEKAGLVALIALVLFWLHTMLRRKGTSLRKLFPWFSPVHRAALIADAKRQFGAVKSLRLPPHEDGAPLASAVHGLGLLCMTGLAATGFVWWLDLGDLSGIAKEAHEILGNPAWAYLVAHAGLGVLHHIKGDAPLGAMWTAKR